MCNLEVRVSVAAKEACPVTCSITLEFGSEEDARNVHRSVEMDNDGYLETKVEGRTLVAHIEADSLKSLLHTLDDFLVCVGVAEKVVASKD